MSPIREVYLKIAVEYYQAKKSHSRGRPYGSNIHSAESVLVFEKWYFGVLFGIISKKTQFLLGFEPAVCIFDSSYLGIITKVFSDRKSIFR